MVFSHKYVELPAASTFGIYLSLVSTAAAASWVFFYKFGRLVLHYAAGESAKRHPLLPLLAFFTGIWAFPVLGLGLGLLGVFSGPLLAFLGAVILALCYREKLGLLPRPPLGLWWRKEKPAFVFCVLMAFLIGGIGLTNMAPWYDGNYIIGAGHLAHHGTYLIGNSDGQPGMVTLVAMVATYFPRMSALTAAIGWGPFFAPFLFLGVFFLLRELFGVRKWESAALLIFAFPLAFKAHEIRASVSGFGLIVWSLFFLLRHLRTRAPLEFWGAVLTLAAAWNFGQYAALYYFVLLGLWSVGTYLGGQADRSRTLWRVLLWTNLIEFPLLYLTFRWTLGDAIPVWKLLLPGTASLIVALVIQELLLHVPAPRLPRLLLLLPFAGSVAWAVYENPPGHPTYNWVFFVPKADFVFFNFGSYGWQGWLFLAGLALALPDAVSRRPRLAASVLWLGFMVSCSIQALSSILVRTGEASVFGEPAFVWDLWKDTSLHWNNPLMVVAIVYLVDRLADRFRAVRDAFTPERVGVGVAVVMTLFLQHWSSYPALFKSGVAWRDGLNEATRLHIEPHVDYPWRGQQSYTLLMYLGYALSGDWRWGRPFQREDCSDCTIQAYSGLDEVWSLIDFLVEAPLRPRETFITADSVTTPEVYLNRQVRYLNSANTVCPIYFGYIGDCTVHLFFWKEKGRIRRDAPGVGGGMAYSIVEPEKNLNWLELKAQPDGSLQGSFNVTALGDYEIYRGDDFRAAPAAMTVDGVTASRDDYPNCGWLHLEPGYLHTLTLRPAPGQPALDPGVPIVLFPRRYWDYEQYVLEEGHQPKAFPNLGIARFVGMASAPITIEEVREILSTPDREKRAAVFEKYRLRYLVLDPLFQKLFPGADALLSADAGLARHVVAGTPVFEKLPGAGG